uniref:DUF4430 domain-containing protein n=1 Tax=Caenorhabditis tropicalis TaxID=1561998 RepID=A0A1I7V2R3_9PELO
MAITPAFHIFDFADPPTPAKPKKSKIPKLLGLAILAAIVLLIAKNGYSAIKQEYDAYQKQIREMATKQQTLQFLIYGSPDQANNLTWDDKDVENRELRRHKGEIDSLNQIMRMAEAEDFPELIKAFNRLSVEELLKINNWKPIPTEFEGIEKFVNETGRLGTVFDEFLYIGSPRFKEQADGTYIIEFYWNKRRAFWRKFDGVYGLRHPNQVDGFQEHFFLKDGKLTLQETGYSDERRYELTRVYYAPLEELRKLI